MIPYAVAHLSGCAALLENVLGARVAVAPCLTQQQYEHLPHLWFLVAHSAVQVCRRVRGVRMVDEMVVVIPVVWHRCTSYSCGEGRAAVAVDGSCSPHQGDGTL